MLTEQGEQRLVSTLWAKSASSVSELVSRVLLLVSKEGFVTDGPFIADEAPAFDEETVEGAACKASLQVGVWLRIHRQVRLTRGPGLRPPSSLGTLCS